MLYKRNIFNQNSVSIFTDASLKTVNGRTSVCPGCCVYIGDILVYQNYHILHNATVNQGELYAIMMGVMESVKYRNFEKIRLFSDSQTSIFAVRDRIFKWISNSQDNVLRGYDGTEVSNIDYIMTIIYYILECNINIEFYHVKGHIKYVDYYDIQRAKSVFAKSNFINDNIDDELIRQISIGNNQVDRYTGLMLDMYINEQRFNIDNMKQAITINYAPFDTGRYRSLIGGK